MPCELWSIDVHEGGLDGRADGLHRLRRVTGLDLKVQAVMITQGDTACALLEAVDAVEANGLREFSVACRSGTHRLVACCVLLAAMVYPEAQICLTTERTRRAAAEHGLV